MAEASEATRDVWEVRQVTTPRGARYYELHHTRFAPGGVELVSDPVRLMSVTTLISRGLPKPALVGWAKRYTAEKAVELAEEVLALKAKGEAAGAVDMLKAYPDRRRDVAAELGTAVHQVVERLSQVEPQFLGSEVALVVEAAEPELRPFILQFVDFCLAVQPQFLYTEAPIYSLRWAYAGTADAYCRIGERAGVLDLKTGGVYPDVALQLAAYRWADALLPAGGLEPVELASLELQTGWVLDLAPEGWRLIEVDCGEPIFRVFLNVRTVGQRWAYGLEREVLGETREGAAPIEGWAAEREEIP
jgi:hypothetical protein